MRVDCGHYVRDSALAASVIGALGLNSAPHAQSLNALANMKKSKVRLGSVVVQAVVGSCYQRRCSSMGARRRSMGARRRGRQLRQPELNRVGLVKSCVL